MKLSANQREVASIALALACLSLPASVIAAEIITVVQRDRQFQHDPVSIAVGDSIRFTNEDPFFHQLYVRSPQFSFSSDEQARGKILTVPFPVAGRFEVRCEIHPKMVFVVEVN
jgi:plastocyanin